MSTWSATARLLQENVHSQAQLFQAAIHDAAVAAFVAEVQSTMAVLVSAIERLERRCDDLTRELAFSEGRVAVSRALSNTLLDQLRKAEARIAELEQMTDRSLAATDAATEEVSHGCD